MFVCVIYCDIVLIWICQWRLVKIYERERSIQMLKLRLGKFGASAWSTYTTHTSYRKQVFFVFVIINSRWKQRPYMFRFLSPFFLILCLYVLDLFFCISVDVLCLVSRVVLCYSFIICKRVTLTKYNSPLTWVVDLWSGVAIVLFDSCYTCLSNSPYLRSTGWHTFIHLSV